MRVHAEGERSVCTTGTPTLVESEWGACVHTGLAPTRTVPHGHGEEATRWPNGPAAHARTDMHAHVLLYSERALVGRARLGPFVV